MPRMDLQEALAMFPANGSAPAMMPDRYREQERVQEAARILADAFRRLRDEQLELLRGIRRLQGNVVRGQDYALVRTGDVNAITRTVADMYGSGR